MGNIPLCIYTSSLSTYLWTDTQVISMSCYCKQYCYEQGRTDLFEFVLPGYVPGIGVAGSHDSFLCPALPLSLSLSGHRAAAFLLFAISSYSHPLRFAEKHRSQDRFPYPFSSPPLSLVFPGASTFWSYMEPCGCDFWGTGVGAPSCIARKEMLNSPRWTLEKEACRKFPPTPTTISLSPGRSWGP